MLVSNTLSLLKGLDSFSVCLVSAALDSLFASALGDGFGVELWLGAADGAGLELVFWLGVTVGAGLDAAPALLAVLVGAYEALGVDEAFGAGLELDSGFWVDAALLDVCCDCAWLPVLVSCCFCSVSAASGVCVASGVSVSCDSSVSCSASSAGASVAAGTSSAVLFSGWMLMLPALPDILELSLLCIYKDSCMFETAC